MFICDKAFEVQSRGLMEKTALNVQVKAITSGKLRRYAHLTLLQHFTVPGLVWSNLKDIFKTIAGFFQSLGIIMKFKPDVVFTKGGFVCLPVGFAAHVMRVPLVIHDSDTRPGLTNKVVARWAKVIATGSPLENYNYPSDRSHYVGVPIGDNFTPMPAEEQANAKAQYGFNPNRLLVVAVGGGLGAVSINTAMNRAAPHLIEQEIGVYVVAGKGHYDEAVADAPQSDFYKIVPFVFEHMDQLLGAADIVVTRGSATFLQELAGLGKPAIIVPAHQLGDQLKNAGVYKNANAALVIDNKGIEGDDRLERAIMQLANDPVLRQTLAANIHAFARPQAAHDMAQLVIKAARASR